MAFDKLHELHAAVILYSDGFHILHYLLCGPSFHDDHARFDGWYQMIFSWQDVIAEQLISLGERPETIVGCVKTLEGCERAYKVIDPNKDYPADVADQLAFEMFNDLYACCSEIMENKEEYPSDVRSTVRKIAKDIRIENLYKQKRRLTGPQE